MQLREMFKKKIDREIQGVVKVGQDDNARVKQELEEYVVTNELAEYISRFFSTYKESIEHPTDKIGVWISGFFGSGKSHFLKILSYLVDNREVDGKRAISFFEDKIKDPIVRADIKKAASVDTDVILFDIDAKSEAGIKTEKDSIVKVLNKVFNEMQGFCGSIPWIADIERQMYLNGKFNAYKNQFREISGRKWEDARDDFYYEEDSIIEALSRATQMSEESARHWFEHAENDYTISIDRFAKRVKDYIDRKENDHHVVFFVDEVGQYIGDNSTAMLNLQTVVHEFGRQCHGQAWIVVTSQEDIDAIVKVKGNDFSKIMGRFTKMSLSSAFVDEVIKKRILEKNAHTSLLLNDVYQDKESILKNLLSFSDKGAEMKRFSSNQEFIDDYPFVPYQFALLQKVFTGVRIHGASGKHLSEGERSLLSAFQESAVHFADREVGLLVPFFVFYETIQTFLDSVITNVIVRASTNGSLTPGDIDVLKLLFLIKYVKEVPANLENLATLMVDAIDSEKIELKKKISESLQRLMSQTLVQKNGEEYIFLTNDEQDVNREIKNMHVESSEVIQQIGEELFGSIYPTKKYRYSTHYNFPFNSIINDRPIGSQTSDIGLKVLTPDYEAENDLNELQLKSMSMREGNVILRMPQDTSYLEEMEEILKIQAYLKLKSGVSASQTIEDIKTRKSREVTDRRNRISTALIGALKIAEIYANGEQLKITEKNPVDRINDAFLALIRNLYSKIDYITDFIDNKNTLMTLLKDRQDQMTGFEEDILNHLALKESDGYIERMTMRHQQMTVKNITNHFSEKPYGWLELDTTVLLIHLFHTQEIKLMMNSVYLQPSDSNLFDAFTRRDLIDRVIVSKREQISPLLLKSVKDLCQTLFDRSSVPMDEDGLMQTFQNLLDQELHEVGKMLNLYHGHPQYPGKEIVESGQDAMRVLTDIHDAGTFYKKAHSFKRDLEDYADQVNDVKGFFSNQRDKFDSAIHLLTVYEKNQSYITDQDFLNVEQQMAQIVHHVSPYGQIHKLSLLCDSFCDHFMMLIEKESEPIEKIIDRDFQEVLDELEKDPELKTKYAADLRQNFIKLKEQLEKADSVIEVIAKQTESDRLKVRCMNKIILEREQRAQNKVNPNTVVGPDPSDIVPPVKKTKTISKHMIMQGTRTIASREDIDRVVDELRKEIEKEFDENTIIKLV